MNEQYVIPLDSLKADLNTVGGKGASLAKLINAGLSVPDGFHITTKAYEQFVAENGLQPGITQALDKVVLDQPTILEAVSLEIQALFQAVPIPEEIAGTLKAAYTSLGSDLPVAVRSSATAEDLPEASFAGQQESYLNVTGFNAVLEAVRKCWASLWTARAIGYRARQEISSEGVALAVVVQTMVPAEGSGIMFTANPLNGARDEVVINAAWGLGEAIVGGAVTPDSLTVEKTAGSVIERTTSRKSIQTVRTESGTKETPVPVHLQNEPVLSDEQASKLTNLGVRIEGLYGTPMDIEWALVGGEFSVLQARPITALPAPPLEWNPPDPKGVYMRGSVVDLMPDPLSPLFETLGIPTLIKQMQPLGKRLTGSDPILSDDYFTAINGYAYMNATMPPKGWWWILTGLIPSYPKLFTKLVPLWRDELHPEYQAYVASQAGKEPAEMSPGELWDGAQEMMDAVMYYVCALMFATMGASAGSEMLVTKVYDKFAKREGGPPASVLLMGWNNIPIQSEKSLHDLAGWCRQKSELAAHILETPSKELAKELAVVGSPSAVSLIGWSDFQVQFKDIMTKFGHIIYQLDFSEDLPLDHPEPMLEIIKMYLRGEGIDPYERQRTSEILRIHTADEVDERLKGFKRWAFRKALKWGQSLAEVREDALADIGLGYPKLRAMLLTLGKWFVRSGVILEKGDIFWLEKEEIDTRIEYIQSGKKLEPLSGRVDERKAFWRKAKDTTPPPMMPVKERIMGVKSDIFIAHAQGDEAGNTLKGVATSAGVVTAPACVLNGPEDFDQMRPGDVLVAGTTTPAWTPLFVMASAVVTDIGGPLSHGSIVAREYGIPAVMGTGAATRRIQKGQTITVDGGNGTVEIHGDNNVDRV